jgi:hypothetical protein
MINTHSHFEELLPLYTAGLLEGDEHLEVEEHLAGCPECQADLKLWQAVSNDILSSSRQQVAPPAVLKRAVEQIHAPGRFTHALRQAGQLLRVEAFLLRTEVMWPASAVVMLMGMIVALTFNNAGLLFFLAPLVAAATLAVLTGPEHDLALEVCLSTPTSQWKILLARLSVVSVYNILLALVATLLLLFIIPPTLLGAVILGWLGPLAFLSALALLLSIWLGSDSAIVLTYALWMLQYIPFKAVGLWLDSSLWATVMTAYQQFWRSPLLLLALSLPLVGLSLWLTNRPNLRLIRLNN